MGTKANPIKITDSQRRLFIIKNWELFKKAIPWQMNAKHQHVVQLANLARDEFGYSQATWNSDIIRGFIDLFFLVVEEKKIVTSLN